MAACAVALLVKAVPVPYVSALALVGLLGGLILGPGQLQLTHSLILFTVALAATESASPGIDAAAREFLRLAVGGLGLGLLVGLMLSFVTSRIDDFPVEITLTGIGAYGSYLLAETFHLSGILAVVA